MSFVPNQPSVALALKGPVESDTMRPPSQLLAQNGALGSQPMNGRALVEEALRLEQSRRQPISVQETLLAHLLANQHVAQPASAPQTTTVLVPVPVLTTHMPSSHVGIVR